MSDKDAAKRRRQARNRQERINRQKRTESVRRPEPSRPSRRDAKARQAEATRTSTPGREGRPSRAANPAPAPGGFLGKLFPPRSQPTADGDGDGKGTSRPARVPQPRESVVFEVGEGELTGLRGGVVRRMAQPGGRAATVAVLLAVAVAVMLFTVPLAPRPAFPASEGEATSQEGGGSFAEMVLWAMPGTDAERTERLEDLEGQDPESLGTQRLTEVLSPLVVAGFALVLLLVVGTAFQSLIRPTRSRTLMISSFALVAVMLVLGQILLPLVAALGFATFQSRKADRLALIQGEG